ncbi:MAG: zinc-dependent alcohol dehydrogenase family protein [Candidatus Sericytochromatia bacterium]|nr:zinc-dependent alcohol dehydrogenase family protein [Candidatus Sericytochromatia bacterium]
MRAAVYHGPLDIRVEQVPDATLRAPTDVLLRVTHACICGSDLWPFRHGGRPAGSRMGHELLGRVEAVGAEVRGFAVGDWAIAPFTYSDGTCDFCTEGLTTACRHGGFWGGLEQDGGQGEAVRVPLADGTLVKLPPAVEHDEALLRALLPLTDVMGTGHHAALMAGVGPGSTVAVVGDGAVGLCGVLAARRLGAARIIMLGRNPERLAIARRFGATDEVTVRGAEAAAAVKEMTNGGARHVLECVGTAESMQTAIGAARPGSTVGYVGVPHGDGLNLLPLFGANIALRGGVAPVRAYMPELVADVLAGKLDPGPVLDMAVDLDGVPEGYRAMDERRAIKVVVRPSGA